jgi:hypothetical protein
MTQVIVTIYKGGAGSGNKGHAGRPGKRGGSAPGRGGMRLSKSIPTPVAELEERLRIAQAPTFDKYKVDMVLAVNAGDKFPSSAHSIIQQGIFDDKESFKILDADLKGKLDFDIGFSDDGITILSRSELFVDTSIGNIHEWTLASVYGQGYMGRDIVISRTDGDDFYVVYGITDPTMSKHDMPYETFESPIEAVLAVREYIRYNGPSNQTKTWQNADMTTRSIVKDEIVKTLADKVGISYELSNELVRQWAITSNGSDLRALSIQKAVEEEFGSTMSKWQAKDFNRLSRTHYEKYNDWKTRIDLYDEAEQFYNNQKAELVAAGNTNVNSGFLKLTTMNARWQELHPGAPTMSDVITVSAEFKPDNENEKMLADMPTQRKFVRAMYENTQEWFAKQGYAPDDTVTLFRGVGASAGKITVSDIGNTVNYKGNAMESWSLSSTVAKGFGDFMVSMKVPVKNIISTSRTGIGCLEEGEIIVMGNYNTEATVLWSMLNDRGEHYGY